jgi:hypothetical protein
VFAPVLSLGRHPLQEQVVDTFVPNDLDINSHKGVAGNPHRILICTGSNACGKVSRGMNNDSSFTDFILYRAFTSNK